MAADEPMRKAVHPVPSDLRAERTARELGRINKRLTIVLLLVALPYILLAAGLVVALVMGGDVNVGVN